MGDCEGSCDRCTTGCEGSCVVMTEAVSVKVCGCEGSCEVRGCEGSCEGVWLWRKL